MALSLHPPIVPKPEACGHDTVRYKSTNDTGYNHVDLIGPQDAIHQVAYGS